MPNVPSPTEKTSTQTRPQALKRSHAALVADPDQAPKRPPLTDAERNKRALLILAAVFAGVFAFANLFVILMKVTVGPL